MKLTWCVTCSRYLKWRVLLLTVWRLLEVLLLTICSCWKWDTDSLFREGFLGLVLMAVVLLISIAACLQLLGGRVQVFCKSRTGMMCYWVSSFLSHGEDVLPPHAQFSSVWEALDLLKYSRQLLKCEITCVMFLSVWVATQCVRPRWSAPVKSLDTIFLLQVSEHAAGGCLRQTSDLGRVFCPKKLGLCLSSQPLLMSLPVSHAACCSPSCQLLPCLQSLSTRKAVH